MTNLHLTYCHRFPQASRKIVLGSSSFAISSWKTPHDSTSSLRGRQARHNHRVIVLANCYTHRRPRRGRGLDNISSVQLGYFRLHGLRLVWRIPPRTRDVRSTAGAREAAAAVLQLLAQMRRGSSVSLYKWRRASFGSLHMLNGRLH